MDVVEYLLFIPLLLYGIAISDLFSQWRRIFGKDSYLPYSILNFILIEIAVYNVFISSNYIVSLEDVGYFEYWIFLLPPLVFLALALIFTPDEDVDTESYFKSKIRVIFILVGLFIGLHFLETYKFSSELSFPRIVTLIVCAIIVITKSMKWVYFIFLIWLLGLIFRIYIEFFK